MKFLTTITTTTSIVVPKLFWTQQWRSIAICLYTIGSCVWICGDAGATPVDLGTTLVVIKFDGGVVVGADTRTSQGNLVSHRYAHKIIPVHRNVVLARSGNAAVTQQLAFMARTNSDLWKIQYGKPWNLIQVAHYLRNQIYQSSMGESAEMAVGFLVAGCDNSQHPRIFSLSKSGALLEEEGAFAVSGSGSTFILGHLDNHFSDNKVLKEAEAIEVCKQAIQLAIQRDGSSGGLTRLCVVTPEMIREITIVPGNNPSTTTELKGFAAATRTLSSHGTARDHKIE